MAEQTKPIQKNDSIDALLHQENLTESIRKDPVKALILAENSVKPVYGAVALYLAGQADLYKPDSEAKKALTQLLDHYKKESGYFK